MTAIKNRFMDQMRRMIFRHLRLEICAVDEILWHKEPNDKRFNAVIVIMRDRSKKGDQKKEYIRLRLPVLQNFIGGHCGGFNWNPRVGDLVYVFFYHERKGVVLGNVWNWGEFPVCRPTQYDIANKGGQWMKPYQDGWGDFPKQPYPKLKKPYCDRWFHGPVKGTTGRGRDWARVYDYCQEGDATPDCSICKTIDSIGRDKNSWDKVYSHETESCEAPSKRRELHVPSGSYLRFDSEQGNSVEYSEGCGHIRLGNATCEGTKKGHLNFNPHGTIDIHSMHEEAPIASEQVGTRVIVVAPEDSSVEYAVEAKDFETGAYIRIMKSGEIIIHSPTKITLDAPLVEETHDNLTSGDNTIVGFCSHGGCSCP